ncbi:OB-fold domain-containing protein [Frankia sp. CNm7]|uniref:OB-fold domain-containing protein n=1 Tax=Frankia nepalensis TaxID=1836974 RepID=A0A937RH21_9ACTN|nr:OB-fold domain-containing protein [Frankia nepalensis]MBL7497764.1 OB-fold domain-containing protein [Frankia nepalensis]MBL7512024.1 OB-fold domain-containing protein [Frankia nepalensis]MBL7520362.1 OB-fold domain-containing protein [Frankia nepalensis]MBL7632076.1 OB-fold domain-containing protein [Frankia nepalensis]
MSARDRAVGPVFPLVARDEASAAFFDAAARGQLLVRRCRIGGDVLAPETRTCPRCGSADLDEVVVSGRGTLVSWAVVHQAPLPSLVPAVPYISALVELAEGPWLLARLVGSDPAGPRAGAEVEVRFVPSGEPSAPPAGEVLPVFALVSAPGTGADAATRADGPMSEGEGRATS